MLFRSKFYVVLGLLACAFTMAQAMSLRSRDDWGQNMTDWMPEMDDGLRILLESRTEATMRLSANEQEVDNAIKSILEQFGNADKQECM